MPRVKISFQMLFLESVLFYFDAAVMTPPSHTIHIRNAVRHMKETTASLTILVCSLYGVDPVRH